MNPYNMNPVCPGMLVCSHTWNFCEARWHPLTFCIPYVHVCDMYVRACVLWPSMVPGCRVSLFRPSIVHGCCVSLYGPSIVHGCRVSLVSGH